jgi:acyl-CoA synthetase (AMP-forming)/AMP-acid ligase II
VVRIVDGPIGAPAEARELPRGAIGELLVRGPVVTGEYYNRPHANDLGKVADGDRPWHRMGDAGWLDAEDRLWFCGRVSQRVRTAGGTLFTVPCESVFNEHPRVRRSALVGVGPPGQARPVIVLEPEPGRWPRTPRARRRLLDEARALAAANPLTAAIDDFLLCRALPVDTRHNAKIFREKLAVWAARRLGRAGRGARAADRSRD